MTLKQKLLTGLLVLGLAWPAQAQVTIPNTLVSGTVIRASDLNTNFATLGSHSLDRLVGGTLSGNITMDPGVTIDGVDLSVALCSSCAATFGSLTVTGALSVNGNAFTNWVATVASGTGITSSVTSGAATATTISLNNTAVTPATYGSSSLIPVLTIDQQGRVTAASTAATTSAQLFLYSNSGTNASTVAANLDTFAVSGLTARDRLLVYATIGSTTTLTAIPSLRNNTDGVSIAASSGNVSAGTVNSFRFELSQRQTSTTSVSTIMFDGPAGATSNFTAPFTTSYQGSWTMALRHSGVTAGGTCDWQWAIYKLVGQ